MKHLAIFDKAGIEAVISGQRRVEARFSKIKLPPFGKIQKNDLVFMKKSGEKVVGQFVVDRVIFFDHPTKDELEWLKKKFGRDMALTSDFWRRREKINFVSLIYIGAVSKFLVPPQFPKKDLRSWVVLG